MNATEKWQPAFRRRIYLLRHGEVDYFDAEGRPYRPENVPLNAEGRLQAEAAGRALAELPIDRVVTSGLTRSVQTAALVVAPRSLPLEHRPALREIETGRLRDLAQLGSAAVEAAFLALLSRAIEPTTRFLGGETFGAMLERVLPAFQELLAEPGWRQLLIVTHGVVNRAILASATGAGLPGLAAFEQEAGCINVLDVDDAGRCLIRLVNYTPANPLKNGVDLTTMERLYLQYRRRRPPSRGGD
jgi:probable phosphoglycerate mutase